MSTVTSAKSYILWSLCRNAAISNTRAVPHPVADIIQEMQFSQVTIVRARIPYRRDRRETKSNKTDRAAFAAAYVCRSEFRSSPQRLAMLM